MSSIDWSKAPDWATSVGHNSGSTAWLSKEGYCFFGPANPPCHPYSFHTYERTFTITEYRPATVITLTPAEVSSGYDRVQWAEGLIRQLPVDHEGRNSWLMNYGDPVKREAACRQLCIDAGSPELTPGQMQTAYRLYDAGYRKP